MSMLNVPPSPMQRWERIARRIRVPLGFLTAALYLFELWRRAPEPAAIAWSLVLVLPGLWLRGYAAGYVKKNRELTQTGPYAHVRNPLYVGTLTVAAGLVIASRNLYLGALFALVFFFVYLPVIQLEEQHLRDLFPGRRVRQDDGRRPGGAGGRRALGRQRTFCLDQGSPSLESKA